MPQKLFFNRATRLVSSAPFSRVPALVHSVRGDETITLVVLDGTPAAPILPDASLNAGIVIRSPANLKQGVLNGPVSVVRNGTAAEGYTLSTSTDTTLTRGLMHVDAVDAAAELPTFPASAVVYLVPAAGGDAEESLPFLWTVEPNYVRPLQPPAELAVNYPPAAKVVALDASNRLPALDARNLTNLPIPPNIQTRGLLLDYRLDEGQGMAVTNYAETALQTDNQFAYCGDTASAIGGGGWTDRFALDPFGRKNGSRLVVGAGNWTLYATKYGHFLPNTTYTASFFVKSTSGSAQTFRLHDGFNPSSDFTVGGTADGTLARGTDWWLASYTFTNGAFTGDIQLPVIAASAAGAALDVVIYGFSLRAGSVPAEGSSKKALGFFYNDYPNRPTWTGGGVVCNSGASLTGFFSRTSLSTFTISVVATVPTSATIPSPSGFFGSISENIFFTTTGGRVQFWYGGQVLGAPYGNLFQIKDGLPHLYVVKYDGTTLRLIIDGVELDRVTVTLAPQVLSRLTVGNLEDRATENFPGPVQDVLVYNTSFTDAEDAAQRRAIAARVARKGIVLVDLPSFIIFEGDSNTQNLGQGVTPYPELLMPLLVPIRQARNIAVASARIVGASNNNNAVDRAPMVDACFAPGRLVVLVVAMGTNDLVNGPEASAFAAEKAYCLARRAAASAAGATLRIIIRETPPNAHNTSYDGTPMDPHVTALNALRRADSSYYDYLVKLTDDPAIGAPGAAASLTEYVDGTHFTQDGQARVAALVLPKLTAALA